MLVGEIMSRFPPFLRSGDDLRRAAELMGVAELGQLAVLDRDDRYVGAVADADVLRALLPRGADVLAAGGSVAGAFALFLERGRQLAGQPVDPLVRSDAVTLHPARAVAEAAVLLTQHGLRRVPVVDDGRLVGSVSQSDVCRAVLLHAPAERLPG